MKSRTQLVKSLYLNKASIDEIIVKTKLTKYQINSIIKSIKEKPKKRPTTKKSKKRSKKTYHSKDKSIKIKKPKIKTEQVRIEITKTKIEKELEILIKRIENDDTLKICNEQSSRLLRSEGFSVGAISSFFGVKREKIYSLSKLKKPILTKFQKFIYSTKAKVSSFQRRGKVKNPFSYEDVLDYLFTNPFCYLSGEPIDVYSTKDWSLDHFIPVSKGGSSDFDNLRICKTKYNYMKYNFLFDEFLEYCKKIVKRHS